MQMLHAPLRVALISVVVSSFEGVSMKLLQMPVEDEVEAHRVRVEGPPMEEVTGPRVLASLC